MTKKLGPTFGDELGPLPITWDEGGTSDSIQGRENLTPEQAARLETVLAAHNPEAVPVPIPQVPKEALALLDTLAEEGIIPAAKAPLIRNKLLAKFRS